MNRQHYCPTCSRHKLLLTPSDQFCQGCSRPFTSADDPFQKGYIYQEENGDKHYYCWDCYRWRQLMPAICLRHQALLEYNPIMKQWLASYKYGGDARLADFVVSELQNLAKKYSHYQWLVLPSSPQHLAERGFHPCELLLQVADIGYACPWNYVGNGQSQASKNRQQRLQLASPFELKREQLLSLQRPYLIFDDVYTTGATMMRAKRSLLQAFAAVSAPLMADDLISFSLFRET
ncbi:ComF family protein [Vaginisenegalia massiliensis]|uniref:ComF family protein n=1 Tax=Vaginisenegalia massiliensis TaxID=2058294 RepID=UPI0013DDA471|nr:ComF family protein [Vaginisenegalia massiliensis]